MDLSPGRSSKFYRVQRSLWASVGFLCLAIGLSACEPRIYGATPRPKGKVQGSTGTLEDFDIASVSVSSAEGPGALRVIWPSVTGASSYQVKYGTSPGIYTQSVSTPQSPLTLSGLTAGTAYFIRVTALGGPGSNLSVDSTSEVVGYPMSLPSLDPASGITPTQAVISWVNGAGAASHSLSYQASGASSWTTISTSASSLALSLSPNTSYRVKVTAVNASGTLDSSELSLTTLPLPPLSLTATISNSSPSLIRRYFLNSAVTGTYTHYCIREGDCSEWVEGALPESFDVTDTPGDKALTIQIKDEYGQVSSATTNAVEYNPVITQGRLLTSGFAHNCFTNSNQVTFCWGKNDAGQVGNDSSTYAPAPVLIPIGTTAPVTSLAGGKEHTCAISHGARTFCWGRSTEGQTGSNQSTQIPLESQNIPRGAATLAAGFTHTCALMTENFDQGGSSGILCWGANDAGQLGDGTVDIPAYAQPKEVVGLFGISGIIPRSISLAAGANHNCVVTAESEVWCWGSNSIKQLGNATGDGAPGSPVPVLLEDGSHFQGAIQVTAGVAHTCALKMNGTVWCWGNGTAGQLGNGRLEDLGIPVQVDSISSATSIAAGGYHTCAVLQDGSAVCWGEGREGQLGNRGSASESTPVQVYGTGPVSSTDPDQAPVLALSAGAAHTCAQFVGDTVKCWGDGRSGQLGNSSTTGATRPVIALWNGNPLGGAGSSSLYIDSATITNAEGDIPTRDFLLEYGPITGSYTHYCILENETEVSACKHFYAGSLPSSYQVSDTPGPRFLKIWIMNSQGEISAGVQTPIRTYDPGPPSLESVSVQNLNPSPVSTFKLLFGPIGGTYVSSCFLVNDTNDGNCTWQGGLPDTVNVGPTTGPKVISVWLKDALDRKSQRRDTAAVTFALPSLGRSPTLAAGSSFSCGILSDRSVSCWGLGSFSAKPYPAFSNALMIDASTSGSIFCIVRTDGQVQCFNNSGNVDGYYPFALQTDTRVARSVSVGGNYSCAVLVNGKVSCWQNISLNGMPPPPVEIAGLSDVIEVSSGGAHICAIKQDQTLWCWGQNTYGQLGIGTTIGSSIPQLIPTLSGVTAIALGLDHSCALASGALHCWGRNDFGQIGNGSFSHRSTPVAIGGDLPFLTALSAGDLHTCAIKSGQEAWCWGANFSGQIGTGGTGYQSTPSGVIGLNHTLKIAAGSSHSCAQLGDGSVRCWGENANGQLGHRLQLKSSNRPVAALGLGSAVAVSAGGGHSCALLANGSVSCWGQNTYGQLGNGATTDSAAPVTVSDLGAVSALSVGDQHTCGVRRDGTVWCWGMNDAAQLAQDAISWSALPVPVLGLSGVSRVAAGRFHSCALKTDGTIWCWGANTFGQLGTSSTTNQRTTPLPVPGITNAIAVSAGFRHTCALVQDGTAYCWGNNASGELGIGSTSETTGPQIVSGLSGATQISAGTNHTCALLQNGTARCWGSNYASKLGISGVGNTSTPQAVLDLSGAIGIYAGTNHTCALLSDGTPACWGDRSKGQVGRGRGALDPDFSREWFRGETESMITLAAGGAHTCGVRSDGTVWCWGEGSSGQLGQGGSLSSQYPLANTQVQDFDFEPGSPLTQIWVDPIDNLTNADGESSKTIHVLLTSQAGSPLAGVTPTVEATNTLGKNIPIVCSASSANGESACSLKSTYAEIKEVTLSYPLSLKAPATTAFKSMSPTRLVIHGPGTFTANTCSPQPHAIFLADANSNPKISGTSWTFNLSASAAPTIQAQFFADPFCTVPLGSNFQFDPGQSRLSFYVKAPPSNAEVYVFGVSGSPYPLFGNPIFRTDR